MVGVRLAPSFRGIWGVRSEHANLPTNGHTSLTRDLQLKAAYTGCVRYFHIDIAEVRTQEGWLYHAAAIDRTSKIRLH